MRNLSDYIEKDQTAIFKKHGAFFAFSDDQFDEKKIEGVEYKSIGYSGTICPVDNCKSLIDEIYENRAAGIKLHIKDEGAEKIIIRELYNCESFYTYEIDGAVSQLDGYGFTEKEIWAAFNKEVPNYEANF